MRVCVSERERERFYHYAINLCANMEFHALPVGGAADQRVFLCVIACRLQGHIFLLFLFACFVFFLLLSDMKRLITASLCLQRRFALCASNKMALHFFVLFFEALVT